MKQRFVEKAKISCRIAEDFVEMALKPLDQHLLALLQTNARQSTAALARQLGVARSTVQSRLARLEASGVIQGYTVSMGDPYRSERVRAHVMIKVEPRKARLVEGMLKAIPELSSLYSVSGGYDFIAVVATPTTTRMDEVLDEVRDLDGVTETKSSVLLATKLQR